MTSSRYLTAARSLLRLVALFAWCMPAAAQEAGWPAPRVVQPQSATRLPWDRTARGGNRSQLAIDPNASVAATSSPAAGELGLRPFRAASADAWREPSVAASEDLAPPPDQLSFDNQLTPPKRWFQSPPRPQPATPLLLSAAEPASASPDNFGPLRRFVWNWMPEGVIPIWGRRTPDSRKDRGIGGPLVGEGWRSQPFAVSGFAGAVNGGPLDRGHVYASPSAYAGVNFAWDYDHYWGIEKRLGFGALNLTNSRGQRISPTALSINAEYRLMYYPLGDTRWRPFLTAGLGLSTFSFYDDFHRHHVDGLLSVPFGVGLKYLWSDHVALRVDLIDELTLAGQSTSTFNYVALTAGLEIRFSHRLLPLPWHRKDN